MSDSTKITVVIPVYNGAEFLAEAIESVCSQNYEPLQIIVVDDGSTDHSAAVARSYTEVLLLQKAHSGLPATLNMGMGCADGGLLAFLDADDRWLPGKLEAQAAVLAGEPLTDMVFCHVRQFRENSREQTGENGLNGVYSGVHLGAMLIRRQAMERVGEFSTASGVHHFVDWYARALDAGLRPFMVSRVFYERRIHARNLGLSQPAEQRRGYLGALRMTIARRRLGSTLDE